MPDLAEHAPKFKELLYRCVEDVRATKAALYLLREEAWILASEYGFRATARNKIVQDDVVIDRLVTKRGAFFLNGVGADPAFSELLYATDSSRILCVPIYALGRLVGLIDMRDKAAQSPFDDDDAVAAEKIAASFETLFAERGLFGHDEIPSEPAPRGVGWQPVGTLEQESSPLSGANAVVAHAERALSKGLLRAKPPARAVDESQMNLIAAHAAPILFFPGVFAVILTTAQTSPRQKTLTSAPLLDELRGEIDEKILGWLGRHGIKASALNRGNEEAPFGLWREAPSTTEAFLNAPIGLMRAEAIVLSVAFHAEPSARTRAALEKQLLLLNQVTESAAVRSDAAGVLTKVAFQLLEPDFSTFPHLAAHSVRVSKLAGRLAIEAALPEPEVARVEIAALVHDVGMRLLDYDRLYRKETLTTEDLALLREHPLVGAALVAASPLGAEIASLVASHHERPDGNGYPNNLTGEQIPMGSRIISICEAFDAMTAEDGYQQMVDTQVALERIGRAAGTQFDADLASRFCRMME